MAVKPKQEFFVCLELARRDIIVLGYKNASRLSDDTMTQIARDVGCNPAVMEAWWLALDHECTQAELTK